MFRILVVGQLTVDVIKRGSEHLEEWYSDERQVESRVGGKALNIAYALSKLGCEVDLVSAVGDDENGKFIRHFVQSAGIGAGLVVGCTWGKGKPVRTPIVHLTEGIVGERQVWLNDDDRLDHCYRMAIESAVFGARSSRTHFDAIVFTLELNRRDLLEAQGRLVDKYRAMNPPLIVVNPAPRRPGKIDNIAKSLILRADVVVPNRFEEKYLLNDIDGLPDAREKNPAKIVAVYNVDWCVTTLGRNGWAWASRDSSCGESKLPEIESIEKVGASDFFTATLTFMKLCGIGLESAALCAGLAAKISISRTGGVDRFPGLEEILTELRLFASNEEKNIRQAISDIDRARR